MNNTLNNVKWEIFNISDIVEKINIAKSRDFGKLSYGDTVFIGRQETKNGIQGFVSISPFELKNCITISMVGNSKAFWQQYDFATSQNILVLRNTKFNKYNAIFICSILNNYVLKKFNYGKPIKLSTFTNDKIILPVNLKGEPDYKFMEEYIKERESKFKEQYKEHTKKLVANLKKRIDKKVDWNNFPIADVFDIKSGKRLTKADMKMGNTPFISAADNNNGVTNFISNSNESLDKNVLGVNYDGNGGMVISFYHPYDCIFSDSVKRFHFKNTKDNKYAFLFAKVSILKQRDKYRYGYKFNETRMKKQQIMLPVDSNGEPDYKFMEDYMKYLEQKKLLEYLDYIK